jgi:mono/diheme cytochrome c family protein
MQTDGPTRDRRRDTRSTRRWSRVGRGGAVAALLAFGTAPASSAATAAGAESPGQSTYEQYCAACHGVAADGHGPVAPSLKEQPADLRKLGQRFGMPLPKAHLEELIDGRNMIRAHGTSDMPVWGRRLIASVPPAAAKEPFKRGTILVILDYLETLQQPAK